MVSKGNGQKASRKNDSTCTKCGRGFWRWESKRTECLLCKPLSPRETQRVLKAAGCDQAAVLLATQEAGRSTPNHIGSSEIHPAENNPSRILRHLFATEPS